MQFYSLIFIEISKFKALSMKQYAFIFPGQGSQSVGMGKDFYESEPLAKEIISQASDILGFDCKDLLFNENDKLNLTQYTQSAIFLVSFIAHKIFSKECGITPKLCFGHSLGEVSAFIIAGGASFENGLKLTFKRGELMAQACEGKDAGMMVVVGLQESVLQDFCQSKQDIWCANYNDDRQIVLAGKKATLSATENALKELGAKRTLLLPMSVASHCPMLDSIKDEFKNLLENLLDERAQCEIISNATTQGYSTKQEAKELLCAQLTSPVLYAQCVQQVDERVDGFIEFGNGAVLKGLNKRLTQKPTFSVSNMATLKETLQSLQS